MATERFTCHRLICMEQWVVYDEARGQPRQFVSPHLYDDPETFARREAERLTLRAVRPAWERRRMEAWDDALRGGLSSGEPVLAGGGSAR